MIRSLALSLCFATLVALVGCKSSAKKSDADMEESMTAGHAVILASDATYDMAWSLSVAFQGIYRGAFVDIVREDNHSMVDSLISQRTDQIFMDRPLQAAESLAFVQNKLKPLSYKVCYYPVYLLVDSSNAVRSLDSAKLRDILVGRVTNWKDLGGGNLPIHVYTPPPGEGALVTLLNFFGGLDSVQATACSTASRMRDQAKGDEGALLVYARPLQNSRFRPLRFERDGESIYPDAETILKAPVYPFKLVFTYVTTRDKSDVAAGYLTYILGNAGQREAMNLGYRPAAVPVKIVRVKQ